MTAAREDECLRVIYQSCSVCLLFSGPTAWRSRRRHRRRPLGKTRALKPDGPAIRETARDEGVAAVADAVAASPSSLARNAPRE